MGLCRGSCMNCPPSALAICRRLAAEHDSGFDATSPRPSKARDVGAGSRRTRAIFRKRCAPIATQTTTCPRTDEPSPIPGSCLRSTKRTLRSGICASPGRKVEHSVSADVLVPQEAQETRAEGPQLVVQGDERRPYLPTLQGTQVGVLVCLREHGQQLSVHEGVVERMRTKHLGSSASRPAPRPPARCDRTRSAAAPSVGHRGGRRTSSAPRPARSGAGRSRPRRAAGGHVPAPAPRSRRGPSRRTRTRSAAASGSTACTRRARSQFRRSGRPACRAAAPPRIDAAGPDGNARWPRTLPPRTGPAWASWFRA